MIVFLKPNKPADDPANYRPIALLNCCFKLFERAILTRLRDVIENATPKEQAGFQRNRNCCDQVLSLTNFIELGFQKGLKTGVVFVDFEDIEKALRADLVKLSRYFAKWGLKPNASKTVSCVFHLNNREANRRLKIQFNVKRIKHDKNPKYLGVLLDRSLTYRPQLKSTQKKLKPRINIVQKLAGSSWGCSGKTLRVTTQALIMSIADYCSPVWMNSCHVKLVDTQINVALQRAE